MLTKSDKLYLQQNFVSKSLHSTDLTLVNEKLDTLITITSNLAGDIKNLQENMTVLTQHSIENFDTNETQDKRLVRVEKTLDLPALAI